MINIMLDLETWGTKPYSTIISIGAVFFDPQEATHELATFHTLIDPISSEQVGFRKDASTIAWWLDPARAEAAKEWHETIHVDVQTALFGFREWVQLQVAANSEGGTLPPDYQKQVLMWGNGADFDCTLLAQAYELTQQERPWDTFNNRCFRTVKNLPSTDFCQPERQGTHHNALSDAQHQVAWLCNINTELALGL